VGFLGGRKCFLHLLHLLHSHYDLRYETGVLQLNKGHYYTNFILSLLRKRGMIHDYNKSDYLRSKMTKAASCILMLVLASDSPLKENKIKALRDISFISLILRLASHLTSCLSSYVLPLILRLASHLTSCLSSYVLPLILRLASHF
jgi:hypothetical protein